MGTYPQGAIGVLTMSIEYYDKNAEKFTQETFGLDLSDIHSSFLKHVPTGGRILDAGCGSGRDSVAFKAAGYEVVAFDASPEMVKIASKNLGQEILNLSFEDIAFREDFDGIWACASLLHVKADDLVMVMSKLRVALKPGGVLYVSFKLGSGSRVKDDGRYFVDLNFDGLASLVEEVPGLTAKEQWETTDHRPGRESEQWVNALLQRS